MAAAVMKVSGPFNMSSHQRLTGAAIPPSAAPSSRSKQPSHSSAPSSPPEATIKPGSSPMRPTFLQSIRSATRSRKSPTPAADDFATVYTRESKGKEKASSSASEDLPKEKSGMLRRLESKVNFRKPAKDSITPAPSPVPPPVEKDKNESKALPSPKSQSAIPASSSSISEALVSPSRGRSRRASVKPTSSSNDGSSNIKPDSVTRHRSTKSSPINIPSASASELNLYSPPETPKRRTRDQPPSPPETPTPISGSRNQFGRSTTSSSSPSPSPIIPRNDSPIRARSPSNSRPRVVSPSHRGLSSASTSNLPSQDPSSPTSDSPRRPSFPREGTPSPVLSTRPRPVSPNQRAYSHNRHFNMSNVSLSAPSNPEHRELIRTATSMLCKEIVKPPAHMGRTESGQRDWEEVELRTRALARLERIWGKSGVSASSSNVNVNVLPMSSSGLSVAGEERAETLHRGIKRRVCPLPVDEQAPIKLGCTPRSTRRRVPSHVERHKVLAACASWGLSNEDLFQRDDLIEGTSESLARVAKTIIALIKFVDSPSADRSKFLSGQGKKTSNGDATGIVGESGSVVSGPYKLGSVSRSASTSTPNLVPTVQRRETLQVKTFVPSQTATTPTTPSPVPASPTRAKRWSPPSGLPTVRSDSSDEGSVPKTGDMTQNKAKPNFKDRRDEAALCHVDYDRDVKDVPRTLSPPPRSPLRTRSPKPSGPPNTVIDDNGQGLFTRTKSHSSHSHQSPRSFVTDSTRASVGGESARESYTDNNHIIRQSRASSAMTDMTTSTTTTVMSSLMDVGRGSSAAFSKFGTIRTITTEATSEAPSITRTEGSSIADEIARKRGSEPYSKDHKLSDAAVVDLTRVAEETEESGSSSRGKSRRTKDKGKSKDAEQESEPASAEKVEKSPIRLGKGKWPDDFLDVLHPPSISTHHNKSHTPTPEPEERLRTSSIISSSPPRKLAIVGASRRNESVESLPQFPRRPTHRARHSIDAPSGGSSLLPREAGMMRRDVSPGPDGLPSASSKVIIRRHNSKSSGPTRNGSYINGAQNSWSTDDPRDSDGDAAKVPFPRTVSADHTGSSTPRTPSVDDVSGVSAALDKAKPPRGRFQSDVEGTKRKARPSSYDELGVRPAARSRFESMVNLGVASSTASASDLMGRDSMDGSAVRKPLIIKEEGKLPTHFQLGNCIGRGQFGSVYRALNLNTGQMVAVKRIRLEGLKEEEVTQLMKEVDLVKRLSHPSIVKYEGMARDADTLSIVLEYAENGSLGQTLKAFGKLNERLVASYVVRILEGLHYLHQSDVVHCDLKAANILTTKNGNVKLSDFGVSLNMRAMEREIKDVAGTPNWMAPEVIELKGASPKSDIWSLACTVIELLTGRPPYGDIPNSMSVMFRIVEDDMPPIPPGCSPLLEDFLKQCFNKDPSKRPNADLLCEHQWLKQNWGAHKELRPQDSIPFLRRVSADLQKSEAVRYLSQIEMPDGHRADDPSSPTGRRISNTSMRPSLDNNEISPREHSFVKTTFSKPMICRVCLLNVKKSAVLCAQCSLICHSKCADNAPPTCDLRAQLLLYAQYAEKGNPSSVYSNPVDLLNEPHPKSPMSDVPYVLHSTPRTSLDSSPPPQSPTQTAIPHPPTAFKFFKRSRTSQPGETPTISISSSPPNQENAPHPRKLTRRSERPQSLGSNSTNPENSMRSTSSAGQRSTLSNDMAVITETDSVRASRITSNSGVSDGGAHIPGSLPEDNRRHKKNKSSGNCIVQ